MLIVTTDPRDMVAGDRSAEHPLRASGYEPACGRCRRSWRDVVGGRTGVFLNIFNAAVFGRVVAFCRDQAHRRWFHAVAQATGVARLRLVTFNRNTHAISDLTCLFMESYRP